MEVTLERQEGGWTRRGTETEWVKGRAGAATVDRPALDLTQEKKDSAH